MNSKKKLKEIHGHLVHQVYEKKMSKKVANKYVPRYEKLDLPWYKRDGLATYIDDLKYNDLKYIDNPDEHFSNVEVNNFDIIHNRSIRPLVNSIQHYKTTRNQDLQNYLVGQFSNVRKDLWIKLDD